MADKMLSIQRRKQEPDAIPHPPRNRRNMKFRGSHAAKSFVPSKTDSIVSLKRRELLAPYDRHLKSFNHTKALDAALQRKISKSTPEVTVSVMQELIRRGHIRPALSGRDDNSLCTVLIFIQKNLSNPQFMSILMDVFNVILDIYGISELMNSGSLESVLVKIKELVNTEVRMMTKVEEIMGSLNLLFTVAENQTLPLRGSSKEKLESLDLDNSMEDNSSMEVVENGLVEENKATGLEGKSLLNAIGSLVSIERDSAAKV